MYTCAPRITKLFNNLLFKENICMCIEVYVQMHAKHNAGIKNNTLYVNLSV